MTGRFKSVLTVLMLLCGGLAQAAGFDIETKSVWPEDLSDEMNTLVAFRAQIAAPADATEAWLDLVAWYSYRVTLNGQFVAFGPARGPKGLFRPDAWKLSLKPGVNDLQVEVTGYNCRNFYLMKQPPFFKAQVRAGDCILARSGKDFKAYRLPRLQKVPRYSYQRTFSEVYRLPGREEGPLALAAAPEPKLIDRVAPEPEFEYRENLPPIAFSHVFENAGFEVKDDRSLSLPGTSADFDGFPMDTLELNTACLAQRLAYRDRRAATVAEQGQPSFLMKAGDSVCFDLGQNDTGFPGTAVTVAKPGRIVFTFDEILLRGEVHGCERYHYDCANIIVWDVTEPGEYKLDAFEPYVMRYLEIGVLSGEMTVARPHFRSYKNSTAKRASFRASDPALEKIFEAAKETMMQNAVDVFMDCPGRERAGWNCDAYFTSSAATLLTGSTALERVFEENQAFPAAFENIPKGMFPMCYPSDHTKDSYIPNWAMWFVLESEEYLQRSGDRVTIDALRPKIEAFVKFLWDFRNADGLLEKLPSWVFVEWSKANSFVQDVNYPSNMTWSQVLDAVARLYGRKDLAEEAARVREKIREQSWNGRFFRDHAVRGADGKLVVKDEDVTETCQYYAFFSGVATKRLYPRLWQSLLTEFGPSRDAAKTHPEVAPSAPFIGDYLRLRILERENLGQQILDETKGYFLGMAEKTGTLWEHADTQASCNHGFASYVAVLLAHSVLGIEKIDLQNRKLVLAKDVSAKLDWVEGVFPVGAETIRVRREGATYRTAVPAGWTVETCEPAADWEVRVTDGGQTETFRVDPPETVTVRDERYAELKAYDPADPNPWAPWKRPLKYAGWCRGTRLRGVSAMECSVRYALDPLSVKVKLEDGAVLEEGRDYLLTDDWGAIARTLTGRIGSNTAVRVDYAYRQQRLDRIVSKDGKMIFKKGVPRASVPVAPPLEAGERTLAVVYVNALTERLTSDNVFYVEEENFSAPQPGAAARAVPKTWGKLTRGETVRILAWGDSVTHGGFLPPQDRWHAQFVRRLKERFPKADIRLEVVGWPGRTTTAFLNAPTNSEWNFNARVRDAKADLVVSEFVNDGGWDAAATRAAYGRILAAFREVGKEWIVLTPHYVRPDWMGFVSARDCDEDPREHVKTLRMFAAENGVGLADAALRWGRLYRRGIPYTTLFHNEINHPTAFGCGLYADALMDFFAK